MKTRAMVLAKVPLLVFVFTFIIITLGANSTTATAANFRDGYYIPFPPNGGDQVLYEFAPLSEVNDALQGRQML